VTHNTTTTTNASSIQNSTSRRLRSLEETDSAHNAGDVADDEDDGFDMFTLKITKPIQYILDNDLVVGLFKMGAFRIEDGNEATHGPVIIQDFDLLPSEEEEEEAREKSSMLADFENTKVEKQGPTSLSASLIGAFMAGFAIVGSFVLCFARVATRRGYTLLEVPESLTLTA